jgi:hypothetical protein
MQELIGRCALQTKKTCLRGKRSAADPDVPVNFVQAAVSWGGETEDPFAACAECVWDKDPKRSLHGTISGRSFCQHPFRKTVEIGTTFDCPASKLWRNRRARIPCATGLIPATLPETKGIGHAAQQGRRGEYSRGGFSTTLRNFATSHVANHLSLSVPVERLCITAGKASRLQRE